MNHCTEHAHKSLALNGASGFHKNGETETELKAIGLLVSSTEHVLR